MIEAYAFLAAFTVQILVVSVLQPAWFTKYARAKAQVQLPDWDPKSRERFLSLYRVVNAGVAVLGLLLLGWVIRDMRRPDWDLSSVTKWLSFYGPAQMLPFVVTSLLGAWYKRKALMRTPPVIKRTVSLERRGIFHFVSPFAVLFAFLAYVLFAGFIIAVQQHPLPGFSGYAILLTVTLVYVLNAFCVYWLLHRRKRWPLETHAYRMQAMAVQVKLILYVSFAVLVYQSLNVTLRLLNMLSWMPFAMSVYFVIVMLFVSMVMFALRRQAEADRLVSSPAS